MTAYVIPVCGVDGNTYSNACFAECEYVVIAYEGECLDLNLDDCEELDEDECWYAEGCIWEGVIIQLVVVHVLKLKHIIVVI